MNLNWILLQAQPAAGAGNSGQMWIWMIGLLVIMWLLMIRPQRKRAKEEEKFRSSLKKGDRVTFSGGIHGKIYSVGETTAEVEVANGVVLTVEKSFLQPVVEQNNNTAKK